MKRHTAKPAKVKLTFEDKAISEALLQLKAIDHRVRKKLLKTIAQHPGIRVAEISKKAGTELTLTSLQLGYLRRAKLVKSTKNGREVTYNLAENFPGGFVKDFIHAE